MKNLLVYLTLSVVVLFSIGCTKDFEELNTDPNKIEKISPGTLLNPLLYSVSSFHMQRNPGFTFDLMQQALPFPSVAGGVHRYDISESAGNSTWNTYYLALNNVKELLASAEAAKDPNYQAIGLTLNAWIYSQLTDSFGDVPMDEATQGDKGLYTPKFNTQQEVYSKILADLEKANLLYDATKPMVYGTDILYGDSGGALTINKWRKFTNSLRMRLLLRVAKKTEMDAYTKLATMVSNPNLYPVFSNNSESAILKVTGIVPNVSPWGRAIDFTSFRAAASFFVDNLNSLNDPRREKWLSQARTADGATTIGYKGIPSAYSGSESQFNYLPSNLAIALVTAPMVNLIMSYSEVEFIKAELALTGKTSGNAQLHYENGVKASIQQWGAVVPTNYFDNPNANYNGTLERIMLQKYLGLFFTDTQQWFEHRRTGFPNLPKGDGLMNNGQMPVRYRYPTTVITNNNANYKLAVENMGGDDINTKVWWEK